MVASSHRKQHILLVPFPAFGHIIPMLELAKKIGKVHDVSLAVSASKEAELTKRELVLPSDPIQLVRLEDGLVDDFDTPEDPMAVPRILAAVVPALATFLATMPVHNDKSESSSAITNPVDVVILDGSLTAPAGVCVTRGIPYYLFECWNATIVQILLAGFGENAVIVPDGQHEPEIFMRLRADGEPVPVPESFAGIIKSMYDGRKGATGHIVNSARAMEEEALQALAIHPAMADKTVYCVGPLIPEEKLENSVLHQKTKINVTNWLDKQRAGSVVYVSFGSIATPCHEQLKMLAKALLALNRPVIWSLRDKHLPSLPEEITSKIPGQFIDPKAQFVVVNWAPQKLVLDHKATAVFLSHCGWNSTLEAFSGGTPIVAWPMFADQLVNAERAVQLGSAVLILDTGANAPRIVPEEEIEDAINKVGGWTAGMQGASAYASMAETWASQLRAAWMPGGASHTEFSNLIKFNHKI